MKENPEAWLAGPLPNIPALLQPVGHALVQARRELNDALADFPDEKLWERPANVASVGFHLRHLAGVLDRLLTYARAEALTPEQLTYLRAEANPDPNVTTTMLLTHFARQVDVALEQLRQTDPATLTAFRGVGRQQLPSTVIGLLVHAAEHTTRHTGQLLVTAKILIAHG